MFCGTQIFGRSDDPGSSLRVTVTDTKTAIDSLMKGNPSPKSNGGALGFYCDHCTAITVLTVAQHAERAFLGVKPVARAHYWDGITRTGILDK